MASPDILFKGIPRGPTRGYTAKTIAAVNPSQVVVPCTGSFSLAYVALSAGISPSKMFCGDISLYSTALGNAIMGEDWRLELAGLADNDTSLRPKAQEIIAPYLDSPIRKAAAVLFMIRLLQYDGKTLKHHKLDMQRELILNHEDYIQELIEQIEQLADLLGGLTYAAQDMWVTLDQFKSEPDTILLVNPPRYTGGYDRMFAGVDMVFEWDEPTASQFTEADYARLMDMLGNEPSHTLMYYATQGEDPAPLWGDPWRSVFADMPASKKVAAINWIIANKSPLNAEANRARLKFGKAKFKLFEGEVTPDSKIWAERVDKPTGDYYRDLFVHNLPASTSEVYVGLIIDGSLVGIIGLHLADLRRGKVVTKGKRVLDHCASVTFAFTVQHPNKRLHKLTLGSIVSSWFWDDVLGHENWYAINGAPRNVKTVMLTKHPENKTARGILKLDERIEQPDGDYKLHYSAPTIDRDRDATLGWWYDKFGKTT